MFLRSTKRRKNGKEHTYWSVVESRRVGGRSLRREGRGKQTGSAFSGESPGAGSRLRNDPHSDERDETLPPAPVGSMLASLLFMGPVAAGRVLVSSIAGIAGRNELAECPEDACELPADRSRQRVAPTSAVV